MNRYLLLSTMILALAIPNFAWSQTAPIGGNNGSPQGSSGTPGGPQGGGEQRFQERKAELLKRMNEHLGDIQKRINCVQAAANHEALRACMPERGERGEGHEGHEDR